VNHEQDQLIAKAQDSLKAARILANQELYDFAISRAYYTMFYIAEAFLLSEGLSFNKHSAVIAKFGEYFARTNRVSNFYHRYLIQAQQSRILADYDASINATEEEALEQIFRAEQFVDLAEAFFDRKK
jgi:uncharacterized protein (UPF0332 family)